MSKKVLVDEYDFSVDEILAEIETPKNQGGNNNFYRFWDMKYDERCVVRFLPDKNKQNKKGFGFLFERKSHSLVINGQTKNVPCLSMYGKECPICKTSQEFYNVKGDKVNGKKYYRNLNYYAQAYIVEDPLPPNEEGENYEGKLVLLNINFGLYKVIEQCLRDGIKSKELEKPPFSFREGTNFIIKKTKQGEYANYSVGSKFANRPTALSDDQIEYALEHMIDLSSLLPAEPDVAQLEGALHAALHGGHWEGDDEHDGSHDVETGDNDTPVSKPSQVSTSTEDEDDENVDAILESFKRRPSRA